MVSVLLAGEDDVITKFDRGLDFFPYSLRKVDLKHANWNKPCMIKPTLPNPWLASKNAQRKKIRESILSNGCPLEWQRFCQKLLHFGPFCISLNFEVSQFWKVELIRDFFIYFSTFLFSAPCVGGVSFVVEKLKSGESLKAVWLSGGGVRFIFWWSRVEALHLTVFLSRPKFNSFAMCCI